MPKGWRERAMTLSHTWERLLDGRSEVGIGPKGSKYVFGRCFGLTDMDSISGHRSLYMYRNKTWALWEAGSRFVQARLRIGLRKVGDGIRQC